MEADLNSFISELVTVALAGTVALFKTFSFVREGELGIRLRFGKVRRDKAGSPAVVHPGFVVMIPFVDTLSKNHVRQQTIRFDTQQILIRDGLIFNINAAVIFRIRDIYRALFEIEDLHDSIADVCMGILRDVFTERGHAELNDTKQISRVLLEELKEKAAEWGIEFLQFNIIDCAPTAETAQIILARTGATMKAEALCEAAARLGIPLERLDPTLAAVLVGVPLVASAGSRNGHRVEPAPEAEEQPKEGLLSRILRDGVST